MSKINGIGVGVPYGTYIGTGYITDSSTFYAPLESSLILSKGTGNPTWSRATAAWMFNELGYLRSVPSGCAVFGGARLVRNLCPTPSNTLAVSGTKTVTLTAAATLQFSMGAGTGTATFSGTGGATGTLAAGSNRVSVNKSVTAGTFIVTASVADLVDLQIADVTGYASTYVPEYVSVGVVATPFFGAGIDGAKYFTTDQYGAPLSAASLLKFRRENAATNNLLFGRDLAGSTYAELGNSPTKYAWVPSTKGSIIVTNGTFDSDVSGWTKSGAGTFTFSSGAGRLDATPASTAAKQTITCVVGTTYLITGNYSAVSGSGNMEIGIYTSADVIIKYQPITTGGSGTYALIFTATETSHILKITSGTGRVADYDNIAVLECSCAPVRTATGLDGIANTATTLTAAATDATILQAITLASAARCASAYVRRKTGTGTISFTQDGGSTWTDITSLINTSTFTRVEITATLANPSVGFKIGTSGDAIEVDGVMNEAGSVATSLILTTTAAVTRNAESLTYQTASNWSDTAGTVVCTVQPTAWSGGAIGSATNGLLLSASNSGATAYDGTNAANGPAGTPSGKKKIALTWGGIVMKVASSGVVGAAGVYDGAMGLATIGVGVNASGYVGDVAIYNYQITDAEMMSITT